MKTKSQVVTEFYTAFQHRDAELMAQCYADDVTFQDPAFGKLNGEEAKDMWRMLCGNAKDLKVTFEIMEETEENVKAYWEANYTFSRTGRRVHNKVDATFTFENGLISTHKDQFNLWHWSQQALGTAGFLIGWSGSFRKKFQKETRKMLTQYRSKN